MREKKWGWDSERSFLKEFVSKIERKKHQILEQKRIQIRRRERRREKQLEMIAKMTTKHWKSIENNENSKVISKVQRQIWIFGRTYLFLLHPAGLYSTSLSLFYYLNLSHALFFSMFVLFELESHFFCCLYI